METTVAIGSTAGEENVEEVVQELLTSLIGRATSDVQPLPSQTESSSSSMTLPSTSSSSTAAASNSNTNELESIILDNTQLSMEIEQGNAQLAEAHQTIMDKCNQGWEQKKKLHKLGIKTFVKAMQIDGKFMPDFVEDANIKKVDKNPTDPKGVKILVSCERKQRLEGEKEREKLTEKVQSVDEVRTQAIQGFQNFLAERDKQRDICLNEKLDKIAKDIAVQIQKVDDQQVALKTEVGEMKQELDKLMKNVDPQPFGQGTGSPKRPKLLLRPLLGKASEYRKIKEEKSEKLRKTRGESTCSGFPAWKVKLEEESTDSDDSDDWY